MGVAFNVIALTLTVNGHWVTQLETWDSKSYHMLIIRLMVLRVISIHSNH